MTAFTSPTPEKLTARAPGAGRALVIRIGALGDLLLTRRLTYSLSLGGLRSTLFAPARHASLLKADSWVDTVLDSESPDFASAFGGEWPGEPGTFELAVVISDSEALGRAARAAASSMIRIEPGPTNDQIPIARQWAEAGSPSVTAFGGTLPRLGVPAHGEVASGATLIHPGSGSSGKNWPIERFLELSHALRRADHGIVWIRGPAEGAFPKAASEFPVLDRPSLPTLGRTLALARLFVGNDSGVSHLAAAVGAPTLALFGPTREEVWRPDGPRVVTVRSPTSGMEGLALDAVLAGIDQLTTLPAPTDR